MDHAEYRAHLTLQGASPATIKAYLGAVRRLEKHAGVPIGEVTPAQAAAWINTGRKRSTRNTYHRHLSAWCSWSGSDLLADVRRAPAGRPAPKPISQEQADRMLAACRDDTDTAVLLLGLLAGLRCAEIAAFRGSQIDPWSGRLSVTGKGGKDAEVMVPPALLRHARRMPAGRWFPDTSPNMIYTRVVYLGRVAGVGHVTPHRLRHTYATVMVRGGVPLTTVQRLLRHSQLATTAIYVQVADEDMAAGVAVLPWAA